MISATQFLDDQDPTRRRPRVRTINELLSRTVQSDRDKANVNSILAKYEQTGVMTHMRNVELTYRDVSEFEDFADVMRQAKVAEGEFNKLPSKVREVFNHDVAQWLDAAHDPEKLEALRPQLEALGVLEPLPGPPAPAAAPPAPVTPTE